MTINYRQTALARLSAQFSDKPRIAGLVESMVAPLATLEQDLLALKDQRWIDSAIGVQLDGCGYIAGVARLGRNDADYRLAIKARILGNLSSATPGALIAGVRFLTHADEVQYIESYPACALLFTDGKQVPANSQPVLQDMAPAAIETVPLMVSYGRAKPLRTGGISQPEELGISATNGSKSSLSTQDGKLKVTTSHPAGGARLAGMALTKTPIAANGGAINVGIGLLSIGTFAVADNGYHLTGVFQ